MSKKPLIRNFVNYSSDNKNQKRKYISPIDHFLSRYSWFSNEEKKNLLNIDNTKSNYDESSLEYVESLFKKISHLNYFDGMYYIQGKLHLTNLLNRLDRMTMAASVEARVPFLDVNLVEFVSEMPSKYKLRWKNKLSKICSIFFNSEQISENLDTPKYILKKLAGKKIPNSIIYRKKWVFRYRLMTGLLRDLESMLTKF